MDADEYVKVLIGKSNLFLKKNQKVHISMQSGSAAFYNGFIYEIKSDFIMFLDDVLGELPVFYSQIQDIEPYTIDHLKNM